MHSVFKGKKTGPFLKKNFSSYVGISYACSDEGYDDVHCAIKEHVWMEEEIMHTWIDQVLAPNAANMPQGILPILLLDMYHSHKTCNDMDKIQDISIQMIRIPGECTKMCQAVDIRINRHFKRHLRALIEREFLDVLLGDEHHTKA